MTEDYDVISPRPEVIVESLRAFGYNLQTAVADLVDNSITAQASVVEIDPYWNGPDSWIRITDNGKGMSGADLVEAMRPGTMSPLENRGPRDLGRFGLGLKTASFSQARRLTVRTKAAEEPEATRCWDLDVIQREKEWALLRKPLGRMSDAILRHRAEWPTRTVVLWEHMDRIVGNDSVEDVDAKRCFLRRIETLEQHLSVVFHRFLTGPKPLQISVNGHDIHAWDPFLAEHRATQALPAEVYGNEEGGIRVQPYVLPHRSKLRDDEHHLAGGLSGWNAQQGFYIYRNRRLLAEGTWLGMFRQEEHFKLARIQVDIPNTLDMAWKIDVRKAQATPPDDVRDFLRRVAEATRARAAEVYRHRGRVISRAGPDAPVYLWQQLQHHGVQSYKINREHPLVRAVLDDPTRARVQALLSLVEQTIPVSAIIGSFSENVEKQPVPFDGTPAELEQTVREVGRVLIRAGLTMKQVRARLLAIDPFQHYPALVQAIDFGSEVDIDGR